MTLSPEAWLQQTGLAVVVDNSNQADAAKLMQSVFDFLGRFVAYPSPAEHVAHTLWIFHTHLMPAWESTPRIAFLSPEPGSGKTRALEITETLVPNPVEAVNVSPSYLFRKVADEDGPPTILFDEIDTVFGPRAKENEELRGLLNAGHRRGAVAGRCVVRGKTVCTEELPAYCAVALAGLGDLPDTILSRSVLVRMRRRSPDERVEPYRRRLHAPEGEALREQISQWAQTAIEALYDSWPDMPSEIQDRAADVWEPLLAVADAVGGEWPDRARVSAVTLVTQVRQANVSMGVRLLADVRQVFGNAESMTTENILGGLCALDESPWADIKGKPLNDRGLAQRLKKYAIGPRVIRFGGSTHRGYSRQDFHDAWQRYLDPLPPDQKSVTSESSETARQ